MFFPESSLNRRPSILFILDHVLTTASNNRPHLTTFFVDCFDGFNKRDNQLGFKSLIVSNKHTIIPACHQHLSSRPRHEKDSFAAVFFVSYPFHSANLWDLRHDSPSGHKEHLVSDRTDGKSVLTVKTVTVGMSKSHGITLFTLMPFNSIFAT